MAPKTKMAKRTNCRRMTHLTPAKLMSVNMTITKAATLRSIHGFGVSEINPAMDSPNPVAHKALPMA